ncbi:MAG: hypothetical protein Unbinned5081contig1003_8 [Prokaryotic dsDNA virus sp.]|nr:MAG: hypothetical protein Unbinned5081contig1003_8 [Prokaryotic dsDNA virus sp.]|tara:strand:- start:15058 stop:15762 length:705 start_codon:yes stop_codon:yes gene_type:complete
MGLLSKVTDAVGLTDSAAGGRAIGAQSAYNAEANRFLKKMYNESKDRLNPYSEEGERSFGDLASMVRGYQNFSNAENPYRDHSGVFSMQDFEQDPGYRFRQEEGMKGIERGAAAKGSLNSGATLKALARYNQGLASDEYQNAYNRFNNDYNNSYNRYNNDYNTKLTNLSNLVNYGMNANSALAGQGMNYANTFANNQINLGNAIAANELNKGNDMKNVWKMGVGLIGAKMGQGK